jgi:RimJ/RimL family protein N-acetyltransferase
MRAVAYKADHALEMKEMLNEPGFRHHPDFNDWAMSGEHDPFSMTILDDNGTPIWCGGISRVWEDVGEAWMFVSPAATRYPKALVVVTRKVFEVWFRYFRRVQAYVNADSEKSMRFVENLGMTAEALLRRHGPFDTDQILYARVKNE